MDRIQLPPHKSATFVLPQYRLVYVSVPKAACTSVKWLLADIAEEDAEEFHGSLSREVTRGTAIHRRSLWRKTPMLHQLSAAELNDISGDNGWMIFAVTRHPTVRLWSAWQSKLLMREPLWMERFGGADWLPRVPRSTEDVVEDFHKFVVSVMSDPEHPILRDRHFTPQADLLNAGLTPYTNLYDTSQFSTMTKDLETHLRAHDWDGTFQLNRSNETPLQPLRRAFAEDVVSAITALYFNDFVQLGYDNPMPPKLLDDAEYAAAAIGAIGMLVERGERIGDLAKAAQDLKRQIKEAAAEQSEEAAESEDPVPHDEPKRPAAQSSG